MSEPPISGPPSAPTPQQGSSIGSALCTECGLCCTGALHTAAVLDEDEIAGARAIGLPVLDRVKPGFALPCPKLENATCTIYGHRPRVCARYKCKLLQRLEAAELGLDEALIHVGTAKGLAAQAMAAAPAGSTLPEARRQVTQPVQESEGGPRRESMELRLRATVLELYLDRHFRNQRDGRVLAVNAFDQADADMEKT